MDLLFSCFVEELHSDCLQTMQLCVSMEYVNKKEVMVKPVSLSNLNGLLCVNTSNESPFLLVFRGKIQDVFKNNIMMCYGR